MVADRYIEFNSDSRVSHPVADSCNCGMENKEIRRHNLRSLEARAGGINQLAELIFRLKLARHQPGEKEPDVEQIKRYIQQLGFSGTLEHREKPFLAAEPVILRPLGFRHSLADDRCLRFVGW